MGRSKKSRSCPKCGSRDVLIQDTLEDSAQVYLCMDCDHVFEVGGWREKKEDRRRERERARDDARRMRDQNPQGGAH